VLPPLVADEESGDQKQKEETSAGKGESRYRNLYETVRDKQGVGSRDKVKHIKRNDQLFMRIRVM